jgi:dTDP-glucose pyrophosphorylase
MNYNKFNIIIPAAGLGTRFSDFGFKEAKFLLPVDINLTPMIEKAITTLVTDYKNILFNFLFILRKTNTQKDIELDHNLHNICKKINAECFIKWIDYVTEGPASSAYLVKDLINNDIPIIISNSDQILDWNFVLFLNKCKNYDGCVLTYNPPYKFNIGDKDKHSFVRLDNNDNPIEFVEKTAISQEALVGVHYYRSGKLFIETYNYLYNNNIRAPNGEFYLSYTYQALLNMGYLVGTYKLPIDNSFYPVGEPNDYFEYYNKNCPIQKYTLNNGYIKDIFNGYTNIFTININNINDEIVVSNKLFILISGKTNLGSNIFIIDNIKLRFLEETKYILFHLNASKLINKSVDVTDYTRGWLIGDFYPSIEKNKNCEIGYLYHKKLSKWDYHYHKKSLEINIIIEGSMSINNVSYEPNDIFIINNNVISCPIFLEDCYIICIKIPSAPNDKYII